MSRRIKSSLLLVFIASLFIVGLLLSFSPFIRDWFIGQNTLRHFEEFVEMPIERPQLEINDWNAIAEIERPSMGTVLQSVFSEPDGIVVGTITIPALNLELAIMDGLTNIHLLSGAATLYPNQPMGNGTMFFLDTIFKMNPFYLALSYNLKPIWIFMYQISGIFINIVLMRQRLYRKEILIILPTR